jgi:peptidoglycan/LPS O-acetylase OafA/YrhL
VLGVVLLLTSIINQQSIMPAPASRGLLILVAVLLLIIAVILFALSRIATDRMLATIALANATSAILLAFWLAAAWSSFPTAGRLLLLATIAGLLLLGVAELATTMQRPTDEPAA